MRAALCGISFVSGAGALVFENLWFRQAGLAFGNGVWAQSVVLASFMAGLAFGNALAIRVDTPSLRPVRLYARLELAIALTGVALVFLLPRIGLPFAPAFRLLVDRPVLLNAARLSLALLLLAVPATAMGLTLPFLAKALRRSGHPFGQNLGALYGWNTLGAVVGALLVETTLVPLLGVRGSAAAAAGLNLTAATLALRLSRAIEADDAGVSAVTGPLGTDVRRDPIVRRVLAAAFWTGGTLLALEVVWFRFLSMFCDSTNLAFALLLAVVLAGIGLGGLTAERWLAARPDAVRWVGVVLALAGLFVVALYAGFHSLLSLLGGVRFQDSARILACAAFLTFPVSFASGIAFTLLGQALGDRVQRDTVSAGALTLANTVGATIGSLAAGFLLLPGLGMERSLALLAGSYGVAMVALPRALGVASAFSSRLGLSAILLYVLFLVLFPFGLMNAIYVRLPLLEFGKDSKILAVREGRTGTSVYLELQYAGAPQAIRLVTNGFSMSGTTWLARRYMGLYAYLPAAVRPDLRRALLICYGVGTTARALVRLPELRSIDVVDISSDVFDMSSVVYPDPNENPLNDPRVRVHVEDGRTFLDLSTNRYDLITSEPPPPTYAGVANLYSQEYFELIRGRLNEGGIATYWLPVHCLEEAPTRAVIRAFCNAFPDCSLWNGVEFDWMLMGSRHGIRPPASLDPSALWRNPAVEADLRDVGLESPERMAALFLADANGLARLAGVEPPVTDDRPARLGLPLRILPTALARQVLLGADPADAFAASPQIARLWPSLRPTLAEAFAAERRLNMLLVAGAEGRLLDEVWLHQTYRHSRARLPVMLWFGLDPDRERVARLKAQRGEKDPSIAFALAVSALADRNPRAAEAHARLAYMSGVAEAGFPLVYSLALEGRAAEMERLFAPLPPASKEFLRGVAADARATAP